MAASILNGLAGGAQADLTDYAAARNGQYGTLDLQTGVYTQISAPGTGFEDLTRLPGGSLYGADSGTNLLLMNAATGSSSVIGAMGDSIYGIKLRSDGTLFGFSGSALYTINPTTAAPTLVGSFGVSTTYDDLAFDSSGHLYLAQSNGTTGSLYSVNQSTGLATLIGSIGYGVSVLEYENGTLYGLTVSPGSTQELVTINTTTGAGTFVDNVSGVPGNGLIYGLATTAPAAVPEPASVVMVSLGLAMLSGVLAARRKS